MPGEEMTATAEFFIWKEEFAIEIPLIDREHQRFFAIINELYAANSRSRPFETRNTLAALQDYALEHFAREEYFLSTIGYSGLTDHQRQHAFLEKTLAERWNSGVGRRARRREGLVARPYP
jgi:hemerythrin-like metal-binding protein